MKKDPHPKWPEPPVSLAQRLQHTLNIFEDYPNDMKVLRATEGEYASYGEKHSWTGLTLGDLRTIADIMVGNVYTLADSDLGCQFAFSGESGERTCARCDKPVSEYKGEDCPRWKKALG